MLVLSMRRGETTTITAPDGSGFQRLFSIMITPARRSGQGLKPLRIT